MENVTCPYCASEITLADIEKDGGSCPECGALLGGSIFDELEVDDADDFDIDEELDDFDDDDDDFGDDFDDDVDDEE